MTKKIITGIVAAGLGIATFGAAADAAPSDRGAERSCFGGIHKAINTDMETQEAFNVKNVGEFVQSLDDRGQGKKAAARGLCES